MQTHNKFPQNSTSWNPMLTKYLIFALKLINIPCVNPHWCMRLRPEPIKTHFFTALLLEEANENAPHHPILIQYVVIVSNRL